MAERDESLARHNLQQENEDVSDDLFNIRPRDEGVVPSFETDTNHASDSESSLTNEQNDPSDVSKKKSEDLYLEPEVVFEDARIKIIVKRKSFERQKRFNLQDLLFDIKLVTKKWRKKRKPPLILSILESLHTALTKIIKRIQDVYGSEDHRQIYVTVIEQGIQNGLNSGNYSILTDPSTIAYNIINSLYYYCQVSTITIYLYVI